MSSAGGPTEDEALAAMWAALPKMITPDGKLRGHNLKPDPSAVIVTTPPKCGTTWVQQIVHGLRSRGSMDFEEIGQVMPSLETGWDSGCDPYAEQKFSPAAYKTHFHYNNTPKGCKKIFVIRDPVGAAPSYYGFFNGWYLAKDAVSMDRFVKDFYLKQGDPPPGSLMYASIWHHVLAAYPHRKDPDLLWLHFEDLKDNLPECVKMIAEFMGLDIEDEEMLKIATEQAGIDFMSQHNDKFDEHLLKKARNEIAGLAADAGLGTNATAKVNKDTSKRQKMSEETKALLQDRWEEVIEPKLGFSTYAEMRDAINRELNRPWAKPADTCTGSS